MSRLLDPTVHTPAFLVGTDIVEIQRVEESILRFGERYVARVYTRDEAKYCMSGGRNPAPHLAARFAAKEAAVKVLRLAANEAFDWRSVEVVRGEDGACELRLHGEARSRARRAGLGHFVVSLSHEERYATAVVLAERRTRRRRRISTDSGAAKGGRRRVPER